MKKRTIFFLIIITIISLILRLKNVTRPDGLWYDELFTYYVSAQNFPFGILQKLATEDFHAPLFFFLLHGWTKLFSDSDVSLRILPVLISTAWIPAILFLGKELDAFNSGENSPKKTHKRSLKTGLIASVLVCFNTFAVFYSQEVRFYSLAGLFVILSCLFFLKAVKTNKTINYIFLLLNNVLLCFTLTYAVIFVFIQGIFGFFLLLKEKTSLKKMFAFYFLTAVFWLPFLPILFRQFNIISESIFRSFEWYVYTPKSWIFTYVCWFEPYLNEDFMKNIIRPATLTAQTSLTYIIILAVIIGFIIYQVVRSKNQYAAVLLGILTVFSATQIFFGMSGNLPFIPRYTLTIYPIYAVLFAYSLGRINPKISVTVVIIMASFSIYFMLFSPHSNNWNTRQAGYGRAAEYIKKQNLTKNDRFLLIEGSNIFSKYTNMTPFKINATDLIYISKNDALKNVFGEEASNALNKHNSSEIVRKYINNIRIQPYSAQYFNEEISKLGNGEKFVIISFIGKYDIDYVKTSLNQRTQNPAVFQKEESRHSLLIAKINLDYIRLALNSPDLILKDESRFGLWNVMIFEKI